jgi:hypothetical protein
MQGQSELALQKRNCGIYKNFYINLIFMNIYRLKKIIKFFGIAIDKRPII